MLEKYLARVKECNVKEVCEAIHRILSPRFSYSDIEKFIIVLKDLKSTMKSEVYYHVLLEIKNYINSRDFNFIGKYQTKFNFLGGIKYVSHSPLLNELNKELDGVLQEAKQHLNEQNIEPNQSHIGLLFSTGYSLLKLCLQIATQSHVKIQVFIFCSQALAVSAVSNAKTHQATVTTEPDDLADSSDVVSTEVRSNLQGIGAYGIFSTTEVDRYSSCFTTVKDKFEREITDEYIACLMVPTPHVEKQYGGLNTMGFKNDVSKTIKFIQELRTSGSADTRKYIDVVLRSPGFMINLGLPGHIEIGRGSTVGLYVSDKHAIKVPIGLLANNVVGTYRHEFWHAWNAVYNKYFGYAKKGDSVTRTTSPFSYLTTGDAKRFNTTIIKGFKSVNECEELRLKVAKRNTKLNPKENENFEKYKQALTKYQPPLLDCAIRKVDLPHYQRQGYVDQNLNMRESNTDPWRIQISLVEDEATPTYLYVKKVVGTTETEVKLLCHTIPDNSQLSRALKFEINSIKLACPRTLHPLLSEERYRYLLLEEIDAHIQGLPDAILETFFPERQEYFRQRIQESYEQLPIVTQDDPIVDASGNLHQGVREHLFTPR